MQPRTADYLRHDFKARESPCFIEPCIPIPAAKPPAGSQWAHEIKHDGYRLIVRRDGASVRLFTRRGYDWTERFPAIALAAAKLRARTFGAGSATPSRMPSTFSI